MPLAAPSLCGQRLLVYGLARSGLSALAFLRRSGAALIGWDDKAQARQNALAAQPDLQLIDPAAMTDSDFAALDALVMSPGVPLNRHPLAARARSKAVAIIGDMELFQRARTDLPAHRLIAITGTNGKSTTTALIHHLLTVAGIDARLGGNIGLPVLDQEPLAAGGIYVFELSSFQIDLCQTLAADISVYTNLSPDHLDRYDGMAGYAASKARLFAMQPAGSDAVIATDDDWARAAADGVRADVSVHRVSAGDIDTARQQLWPALAGPHNAQNAALAITAAQLAGANMAKIGQGLATYPGLPHRMEIIRTLADVRYVNDSKATNPTSTAPALQAYDHVHWILGGQAKTTELDACMPYLSHVKAAYVIGEAAPLFERLLAPELPVTAAGTLDAAVAAAAGAAQAGDTILLSPTCASFDQFRDYEARGDAFRAAVEALT